MRTQQIKACCHCGNVTCSVELTSGSAAYSPRACDCSFCVAHAASWLSDPEGKLKIIIRDWAKLSRYRQGTGNAEFLVCGICGVLAAVIYEENGSLHGAVNSRAVEDAIVFGEEIVVSPQKLDGGQKIRRWQDIWFRDVSINYI